MKKSLELGKKINRDSKIRKGNLRDYFHASPIRKSFKTVVLSEKIEKEEEKELEKKNDSKIKLKKISDEEENSNDFNIFDFLKDNIKEESSEIEIEKDEKKKFLNLADFRELQKEIIIYSKTDFNWFFEDLKNSESAIKNLTNYFYVNSFLLNNSLGFSKKKSTIQSKNSLTNNCFSNKLSSNGFSNSMSSSFENFYESLLSLFWKFKTTKNLEFFFINSIFDVFGFSNHKILKDIFSKFKIEKEFKNKNKLFFHLKVKNNKSGIVEKLLKNKKDWIFLNKNEIEDTVEFLIPEDYINFFIQEIFNVFNEKQFYFEIFSNFEFQNAVFKNMDFSRDFGERGYFGNNFYYSLAKNLLTDSKKFFLKKKKEEFLQNKEFLQNVGNEVSYHYIELNGGFYGIKFFTLLRYFYSNNNDCKILFKNN